MKQVPDTEVEDCYLPYENSMDMDMTTASETAERFPALKHDILEKLRENNGESHEQRQDKGKDLEEPFAPLREEDEDVKVAANEKPENQLAGPMRDLVEKMQQIQGFIGEVKDYFQLAKSQPRDFSILYERNQVLEAQIAAMHLDSSARRDAKEQSYAGDIVGIRKSLSNQNKILTELSKRIKNLEAQNATMHLASSVRRDAKEQSYAGDIVGIRKVLSIQNKVLSELSKRYKNLEAQKATLQQENMDLTTSYRAVQKTLRQRSTGSGQAAAPVIGTKVTDGELRSLWKQLKFSIQSLALFIVDRIPGDRFVLLGQEFDVPEPIKWAVERLLWFSICKIVFESDRRHQSDGVVHIFKDFRRYILDDAHNSTRLGLYSQWFNDGWKIIRPSDEAVETMLQNACGDIYMSFCGESEAENGIIEDSIQEELRDILTLAMELDDLRMQSRAIITLYWENWIPGEQASYFPGYADAVMKAVNMEQKPMENARVQFVISPALLKKGNAGGRNYDSEMVLAKADVFMYEEEEQN